MDKRYISIKEIFKVVWSGKGLVLICAGILALVTLAGSFIYESSVTTVSTVVGLEWDGFTRGEYPDGSSFDYNDMFQLNVIRSANKTQVDIADIRENLTISPITPNDILAIVQSALQEGEQITYYASEYKVTLDVGKSGMSVPQGQQFLTNLITEFRLDFEKKYVQSSTVLDFTDTNYEILDYVEIQKVFKSQLDVIQSEMATNIEKAGNYNSLDAGYSFNDILVRESLLRSIQYADISSQISNNLLAKDSDTLVNKLVFEKEELEAQLTVANAKRDMIADLITNYNGNTSTIIIPGTDQNTTIQVDTYYQELIDQSIEAQVEAASLQAEIDALELLITRYKGEDPEFQVDALTQDEIEAEVDALIVLFNLDLKELVDDANAVLLDYNSNLVSGQIYPLMAPQQERSVPLLLFTVVGFVVGTCVGIGVVLFRHDWE